MNVLLSVKPIERARMQTESLPKEGQSFVSPVSPEETFFLSATRVSAKTFLERE